MIGIGVIMEGADISELNRKVGVKTQVVHAGTWDKNWERLMKQCKRAELEKVIGGTYTLFASGDVVRARRVEHQKQ